MLKILTNITQGKGKPGDIELLQELSETAMEAALCALGKSAPNPFLSTLRYFRDEYEAHINEKRCPALSCKELISFYIDPTKCKACMALRAQVSGRGDSRRQEQDPHRGPGQVHEVRDVFRSLPAAIWRGDQAVRRAGSVSHPRNRANNQKE